MASGNLKDRHFGQPGGGVQLCLEKSNVREAGEDRAIERGEQPQGERSLCKRRGGETNFTFPDHQFRGFKRRLSGEGMGRCRFGEMITPLEREKGPDLLFCREPRKEKGITA